MAYVVGYVSRQEREELERRGWEVEDFTKLMGENNPMLVPTEGLEAIVVYVDSNVFEIMSGPDWEKGPDKDADEPPITLKELAEMARLGVNMKGGKK